MDKEIFQTPFFITKETREQRFGHRAAVLWFTGLSGAGKSTIADALEKKLIELGMRTYVLDGDNIRHGLNKDLGFEDKDRTENLRRAAEVANLMADSGCIVLCTFISPSEASRQHARSICQAHPFFEIFIDTDLDTCERRDPKGLYKRARAGQIQNFTGIQSDFARPENPEIQIHNNEGSVEEKADRILEYLNPVFRR